MPWLSKERQLGSLSDIRTMVSDGSLAAFLEELHASARRQIGEDCVMDALTVRMEDTFRLADYEPGEELAFCRTYTFIAVSDPGDGTQAIIGAAGKSETARKICGNHNGGELDGWVKDGRTLSARATGSAGRYVITAQEML